MVDSAARHKPVAAGPVPADYHHGKEQTNRTQSAEGGRVCAGSYPGGPDPPLQISSVSLFPRLPTPCEVK